MASIDNAFIRDPRDKAARELVPLFHERSTNWRSIAAGVLGSLLFHVLFVVGVPRAGFAVAQLEPPDTARELDFELAPEDDSLLANDPSRLRFVETNPDAPDNIPDKTDNFSARNQQAANETMPEEFSADRTPARDGEDDVPYDKLIDGTLDPQEPTPMPSAAAPETIASRPEEASDPAAQTPLPGFERDEPTSDEGLGSSIAEPSPHPTDVAEKVEGSENAGRETRPLSFAQPASPDRPAPAPRPRLPRAPPGAVKRQVAGVSQTGYLGVDANFSQYGEYLERMVEAVSQRWHSLCASRSFRESNTMVMLRFTVTREGRIKELETMESSSQALGALLCRSAVESGQPYGEWTRDMVSVLGEEQTVYFRFYYR